MFITVLSMIKLCGEILIKSGIFLFYFQERKVSK